MRSVAFLITLVMASSAVSGCLDKLGGDDYNISITQIGTPTDELDLLFVVQLDSNASIDFTDIHIDLGKAMGCTGPSNSSDCSYAEQGDMDGLWEQGEGLEIYEAHRNWCDYGNSSNNHGDCTEITFDIYLTPRNGPQFKMNSNNSDISVSPFGDRTIIQMN